jgi:hypothetical protein
MASVKPLYVSRPQGGGGLAGIFRPARNGYINVVKDFPWTLTPARNDVPRVILKEYEVNESTIQRQVDFYVSGIRNFGGAIGTDRIPGVASNNILSPYSELYPKTPQNATGFRYDFPYISDINFEVNTPVWQSLDTLEQAQKGATGLAGVAFGQGAAAVTDQAINAATAAAGAALAVSYPKVGIMDRPRLWQNHDFRNIDVKFPLFNTMGPDDWKTNRQLCELLVNQNLYNKRDLITGIPPVFYELLIYGQHYSYASCVTRLVIYNRGNMRLLRDDDGIAVNVPDAYEVNITFTDMVMPSKNQFQSIRNRQIEANIVS